MNRFTADIDAMTFDNRSQFSILEAILFRGTLCEAWWQETYGNPDPGYDGMDYLYLEVMPLYASLLANMSDEDISAYLEAFK